MTQPTSPPANWYPDPDQPGGLRYWDGATWTDHRTPATHTQPGNPPATNTGPGTRRQINPVTRTLVAVGVCAAIIVGVSALGTLGGPAGTELPELPASEQRAFKTGYRGAYTGLATQMTMEVTNRDDCRMAAEVDIWQLVENLHPEWTQDQIADHQDAWFAGCVAGLADKAAGKNPTYR